MGENKTSKSVILLPGDIVMNTYAEGDGGGARCRLCRYSDGTCTVGLRKVHDRQDPQCRLHGVTSRGNVPIARCKEAVGGGCPKQPCKTVGGECGKQSGKLEPPLSEMTGFETRRGLMLLYNPGPGDEWINRLIVKTRGGWKDTSTGEILNKAQAQAYGKFLRRHRGRNKVGDTADKLVRMVDKYLPLQADETRAYVCRFPEQAESLLKRVKKIRKRLRASQGESRSSTTQPSTTATGNTTRKRKGEERTPVVKSEEKAETLNEHAVNTAGTWQKGWQKMSS